MDITDPVSRLVPPRPRLRQPTPLISLVLVAGALSSLLMFLFFGHDLVSSVGSFNQKIPLPGTAGTQWYVFKLGSLQLQDGLPGYEGLPFSVLEASPLPNGDTVVLAHVPHQQGTVLGILRPDKSFMPLVMDGSVKYDLAVRPDGLAMYAFAAVDSGPQGTSTETIVQKLNPSQIHILLAATPNTVPTRLAFVDLQHPAAPMDMGIGRSPRATEQGFFVAITSEGLVAIDPVLKTKKVLLGISSQLSNGSVTPDGHFAVLPTANNMTLYRIDSVDPATITKVGEARGVPNTRLVLTGPNKLYAVDLMGKIQIFGTSLFNSSDLTRLDTVRLPSIPSL